MAKTKHVAAVALGAVAIGAGVYYASHHKPPAPSPAASTAPASPAGGAAAQCDPSLWTHVYKPERLIAQPQGCISVTGTITDATADEKRHRKDGVRHEADGDTHGWLTLDQPYKNLLNAGNMTHQGGNLVFEIVCRFRVTQPDAEGACEGYTSPIQVPPIGSHVRITGTYVQDTNHGKWMEIHPVSSIVLE